MVLDPNIILGNNRGLFQKLYFQIFFVQSINNAEKIFFLKTLLIISLLFDDSLSLIPTESQY